MGTFPARVVCVSGWRVCSRREQELVKTFTAWQKLASLVVAGMLVGVGSGVGGVWACGAGGLCFWENIGRTAAATFDNLYIKCYNKYNDDNKKAICHQSPKFALYGVFAFRDIKSCGTPENAVQRIYIKYGNTKRLELCVIQGQHTIIYMRWIYNRISIYI